MGLMEQVVVSLLFIFPMFTRTFGNSSEQIRVNESTVTLTTDQNRDEKLVSLTINLMGIPVFTIAIIVGLSGNFLALFVVLRNKAMRNSTNVLVCSLAVADIIFLLLTVPLTIYTLLIGKWELGNFLCKFFRFGTLFTATNSAYTLTLMALDRFMAVVFPFASIRLRNAKNALIAVFSVWIFSFCVNSYAFVVNKVIKYESGTYCKSGGTKDEFRFIYLIFFFVGYLTPFIIICCLYFALLHRLRFGRTAKMAQSQEANRSKRHVSRMVIIVICVFGACWLPLHVIFVLQSLSIQTQLMFQIQIVAMTLAYSNSAINPILYTFLSENFRSAFVQILFCHAAKRNVLTDTVQQPKKSIVSIERTVRNGDISENHQTINADGKLVHGIQETNIESF